MLARDLAITLRARITWVTAAAAALLVGHGFVLAVDIYSAGSRSALGNLLMNREFDPLLGIVRPTLGGLNLALSLFAPLSAARVLAADKDRHTFVAAVLASGSVLRFVLCKWLASFVGALLPLAACQVCLGVWGVSGGHLALAETLLAGAGQLLYAGLACALGVGAAAFCASFSQAATAALGCVAAVWAIDAAEGFSAVAWLGGASAWSPSTYLVPFERGTLQLDGAFWYLAAIAGLLALAYVGCRFDLHGRLKYACVVVASIALVCGCMLARRVPGAWDLSEARRHSLPPAAAAALAELPGRLQLSVRLDREDSRRSQLERDTLAKLRLARPDLELDFPLDDQDAPAPLSQADDYGTITVQLGARSTHTTSTSRRELTTRIFELADRALPDWKQPEYRGYPCVIEGSARRAVMVGCYCLLPLAFIGSGWLLTRARRHT